MILNLSNHPSNRWTTEQLQIAKKQFGEIQDIAFPQIPPTAEVDDIRKLVTEYEQQIRAKNPDAVHIMGEMTFTYALVNRLLELGIPCVASTTERISEEKDGVKTSRFQFIKFRNYGI